MAANKTQILVSARDQASAVFGRVAKNSTRAQKSVFGVNNALKGTDRSITALSSSVKGLLGGVAAGVGIGAIFGTVKDAVAIKVEYDKINNVLKAVTGSTKDAAKEFKFLSDESERLGIQLRPLAQSYTRMLAAGKLLGVTTKDTQEIFTSFSEALTGFGATREQSIRVFTALEQMLSKGKVSAEELRQQLGESLVGSLPLAARSLGVTSAELDKMLKNGEVLTKDFLLPFARAVRNEFGGAAVEGAKLLNAEFSRTINVLDQVKLAFVEGGESGSTLADSLARVLKSFREFLSDEDRLKRIADAGVIFGAAMETAAVAIQKIANVVTAIPLEILVALGSTAGGLGRRVFAGKAGISGSGIVKKQRVKAYDATRTQRNFVSPISVGQLSSGTQGYIQGMMSGRTEWVSGKEIARRERRDKWRKYASKSKSVYPASQVPDNITQLGPVLAQLAGQQKIAASFEKSFVPAVETATKKVSKLSRSAGFLSGAFMNVLGPLGLLATAATALVTTFGTYKTILDEERAARKRGSESELLTKAFLEVRKRRQEGGSVGAEDVDEILFTAQGKLLEKDALNFVGITDAMRKSLQKVIETGEKVADEILPKVDNTIFMARQGIERNIDALKTEIEVRSALSGEAATTKLRFLELRDAALRLNVKYQDAVRYAKEQVAAENKLNKIKKDEADKKKAADALSASKKSIEAIQEEIEIRKKYSGASKKFVDQQIRIAEIMRGLVEKGVAPAKARAQAVQQEKAESQLRALTAPKAVADSIGAASLYNSVQTAERIQDRFQNSTEKLKRKQEQKDKKEEKKQQKEQTQAAKNTEKTIADVYTLLTRMGSNLRLV